MILITKKQLMAMNMYLRFSPTSKNKTDVAVYWIWSLFQVKATAQEFGL